MSRRDTGYALTIAAKSYLSMHGGSSPAVLITLNEKEAVKERARTKPGRLTKGLCFRSPDRGEVNPEPLGAGFAVTHNKPVRPVLHYGNMYMEVPENECRDECA